MLRQRERLETESKEQKDERRCGQARKGTAWKQPGGWTSQLGEARGLAAGVCQDWHVSVESLTLDRRLGSGEELSSLVKNSLVIAGYHGRNGNVCALSAASFLLTDNQMYRFNWIRR